MQVASGSVENLVLRIVDVIKAMGGGEQDLGLDEDAQFQDLPNFGKSLFVRQFWHPSNFLDFIQSVYRKVTNACCHKERCAIVLKFARTVLLHELLISIMTGFKVCADHFCVDFARLWLLTVLTFLVLFTAFLHNLRHGFLRLGRAKESVRYSCRAQVDRRIYLLLALAINAFGARDLEVFEQNTEP